jgi:hypothetical protein
VADSEQMNAASAALTAPMSFWEPFRTNMMRSLGVDGASRMGNRKLPVVVYIDRQVSWLQGLRFRCGGQPARTGSESS